MSLRFGYEQKKIGRPFGRPAHTLSQLATYCSSLKCATRLRLAFYDVASVAASDELLQCEIEGEDALSLA